MLDQEEMDSLIVDVPKKPSKRLTTPQIELCADLLVSDYWVHENRLAALLLLADEIEWLAEHQWIGVDALLTTVRQRAMRELYDDRKLQEAIIQLARNNLKD